MSVFVTTIRALTVGDTSYFREVVSVDLKEVDETLRALEFAGMTRRSRKDWVTLDHPQLGTLQWKSGYDFRSSGVFLFLRVNGKLILKAWPKPGQKETYCEWVSGPDDGKKVVEDILGSLQKGSKVPSGQRELAFNQASVQRDW